MADTMSLFGGSFEPADVPDSATCPACGTPSPGGRCARCRAAGHEARCLPLATLTTCNACELEPMAPGQDAPGEPGYCAGCLATMRHACPDCGGTSRGFMLMTGHRQRECNDCGGTWLY